MNTIVITEIVPVLDIVERFSQLDTMATRNQACHILHRRLYAFEFKSSALCIRDGAYRKLVRES